MSRDAILVVDDEESTRAFLSDFLGSRGYKVEAVATGEEAVARITRGDPPAVTLLDLLLPDIDGLEVLTRVKNANGSLPVIIMSAVGQTKTVVEAVKRGASDYLVKPFEEQELELAFGHILNAEPDEVASYYYWRNNEDPARVWQTTRTLLRRIPRRQLHWQFPLASY